MSGTQIPAISGPQFAARLADLFPRGWCSDDAKQSGNVYALLLAVGNELGVVQTQLQYAASAQRIQTETFPELDFASIDFLGSGLPRPAGATDAAYATAIIDALFHPAATRPALQDAIAALTGFVPRMLEPWSVNDTGAWSNFSYWNVDTAVNPARWGNGSLRYQGYIETAPPSIPAIGPNNPILTWGTAYWNVPGYFLGIIQSANLAALNDLVNRLRAYGTIVWLKLVAPGSLPTAVAPGTISGLTAVTAGNFSIALSWTAPATGTPPYVYNVFYRQAGTNNFLAGNTGSNTGATVVNLASGTVYEFQIVTRNIAGFTTSGIVSATTAKVPPAPATNLIATLVQATAITLSWSQPTSGTPPFNYSINYRPTGTTIWQNFIVGQGALTVTVINLIANTQYDLEVVTTNV